MGENNPVREWRQPITVFSQAIIVITGRVYILPIPIAAQPQNAAVISQPGALWILSASGIILNQGAS
jgi:hypothetical protein